MLVLACASALAWLVLLVFRHGFWLCDQKLPAAPPPDYWPRVAALVPARNEEANVARCLRALAGQDYAGSLLVVLINDASTDGTAEVARQIAREHRGHMVRAIDAPPLEAGWAGKLWALNHGIGSLPPGAAAPEYLWFTDADVVHPPQTLRKLVAHAKNGDYALVSLMVRLPCESFWERLLVPAFIFFFQMLYPFRAVNTRNSPVAGAAGGCMLLERGAFEDAGGLDAVKDRLIDDCALAGMIKRAGHAIWLGLADASHSLRRYDTLADFWQMVTRSAFVQLRHSAVLLVIGVAGLFVTFLAAPLIALGFPLHGNAAASLVAVTVWGVMAFAYAPCQRYHGLRPISGLVLPAAAALYLTATVHSAIKHWCGFGPDWKNRTYHPK